jgi:AcrR family transcriptional regulator
MSCDPDAELDPRVRRTRALLQEALRVLLTEKRLSSISVAEIAARATVNRNTFYLHYEDKFALLESVLRADLRTMLHERFRERPAFTRANFAALAAIVFRFLGRLHADCPRTAREAESRVHAVVQEEIRQIIDSLLPADFPQAAGWPGSRETAVTVISWSLFGSAYEWGRGKREHAAETVAEELAAVLIRGASGVKR